MHLILAALLLPSVAMAQNWSPTGCGDEPRPPHYDLADRGAYNNAVKDANTYQHAARAYSACVLKRAQADEISISRQAQSRIAEIQAVAVGTQQEIYARLADQAARFKAAAAKLSPH